MRRRQPATVYFRADGNSRIGLGHVTRSLALADMLSEQFRCVFLIQNPTRELAEQVSLRPSLVSLPETTDYLAEARRLAQHNLAQDDIVVLDGYDFRTDYQRVIRNSGCKLVCIDDLHAWHFVADVVINQAGGVSTEKYSHEPSTRFCLGPAYALLRKPFLELVHKKRDNSAAPFSKIMIAMGGADTDNHTLRVLKELAASGFSGQFYIVTGSAYRHSSELKQYIRDGNLDTELFNNLDAHEMADMMLACGVAITPPSGIAYEYLCSGGTLYLRKTADNQKDIYDYLIKNRFTLDFDREFSLAGGVQPDAMPSPIDGLSPGRLDAVFARLAENSRIEFRKATVADVDQYYEWVNEPGVRNNSIDGSPIAYSNHVNWFSGKLAAKSTLMYCFESDGKPMGQVRFDLDNGEILIDYSLARDFRGLGLGKTILAKAIEALLAEGEEWRKPKLAAIVKASNVQSCKVFMSLDFQQLAAFALNDETYHKFTK